MSEANFAGALRRLLAHEGGYSNHPADPGGPTKYGITIGDYRRYINPNASNADVKAMSIDDAKKIYRTRYWDAMRCSELPGGIDYAVFDYGVNSGVARAGKVLRRVLGLGASTPAVTAVVTDAAARASPQQVIEAICDERLRFLKSLNTWPTFGAGWSRRVSKVRAAALAMANGPAPDPASKSERSAKTAIAGAILSAMAGVLAALAQSPVFWIATVFAAAFVAAAYWFLLRKENRDDA